MHNTDLPDLASLYDPPAERIQKSVLDRLVDFHRDYLAQASFFCLATGSQQGLDASPRGGPAGFVLALDEHHVAFADWPGNNRIESLRNLAQDDRLGMLFLFPGLEVFMRINGRGRVTTEASLLARLGEGEKLPKVAIVVTIDEVLFHCGKAINRARLWDPAARLDRHTLPTPGHMVASFNARANDQAVDAAEVAQLDAHYEQGVRTNLYG
jgi:PPOX class probable FMN-dependent enzyme